MKGHEMDVFAKIDEARRQYDVLAHPFYQRWSAGELSAEELAFYAGEYRHAVVALAQASSSAAAKADAEQRAGLERHANEEHNHIALWDEFAGAASAACEPAALDGDSVLAETAQCAQAWTAGTDLLEHLAVLYAIEASQPAIASTKLEGLVERYGYQPEGPAVEYFRLHATLDVEHARQAQELISELISDDEVERQAQIERMLSRATAALQGNWTLLDGVDSRFALA